MSRRLLPVGVLMVLMSVGLSVLSASADEKPAAKESATEPVPSPKRPQIRDVILKGNSRMSSEQIKARLRTQPGKEYDPADVDEDVRDLYKTRQFSNIRTLLDPDGAGKVKVYFLFVDLPNQVQKITFLGAKHIKPEKLRTEIGIRTGTPLNPKLNQEGCQKILDKYAEMGRPFASCTLVKGGAASDTEVVYQIAEGPKVKVRDIQFSGNTFVSAARLATQIHSFHTWFHVLGGIYNSKRAESDVAELTKYFRSFGYQDVKVSLETRRSADSGEVTLVFHIQEGPRYRVKDIPQVVDAKAIPHEQLESMLTTKSGEHLDENKIHVDEARIRNYYGYTGRDVQVQHNYLWSQDAPGVTQVQYLIEEHPQARQPRLHHRQ